MIRRRCVRSAWLSCAVEGRPLTLQLNTSKSHPDTPIHRARLAQIHVRIYRRIERVCSLVYVGILAKSETSRPPASSAYSTPDSQVELSRRLFELQTANQKLQTDLKSEQLQSKQLKQQLQQLERRAQQAESNNTCLACAVQPRSALFSPCHHMLHCYSCACKYSACPICRIKIATVIEIKKQ